MEYASLEQRMAHGYQDLFPDFIPDENGPVSAAEQKFFYDLMQELLCADGQNRETSFGKNSCDLRRENQSALPLFSRLQLLLEQHRRCSCR